MNPISFIDKSLESATSVHVKIIRGRDRRILVAGCNHGVTLRLLSLVPTMFEIAPRSRTEDELINRI